MKKCRWFQAILCLAIVGFICCQQALAQAQVQPKFTVHHIRLARHAREGHVRSEFTAQPAPGFYPIYAGAGIMPNQDNSTSPPTDMWPCDPYNYVSQYCQDTLDIDWPVGWTAQGYGGGLWSGYLQYSIPWKGDPTDVPDDPPCFYTKAPALNNGGLPFCTQLVMGYEDDTSDTSDELYQTYVVTQKQGTATVYLMDTGIIDQGTNGGGPIANLWWTDALFGSLGQQTTGCTTSKGKPTACVNDGMCLAEGTLDSYWGSYNYASGKVCVNPIVGPATVTITTYLGNPNAQTQVVKTCGATGTAACSIKQTFTIFLTDDELTSF
ncbi:MAG: hypothetical protein WAL71_07095 [Terriglobales bacterium]